MQLDWLILADHAQVTESKLYLLGGGWDRLTVNTGFPVPQLLAIAAAFRVPWIETNQRHKVELEITDQDHATTLAKVEGEMEVGRPAGIEEGSAQRTHLAVNFPIQFERPGTYEVVARINGEQVGQVPFSVVPGPLLAFRMATEKPSRNPSS